ncbi:DUF2080 family transposase-associated protein [Candidatus Woesearchaeota archaeon]|nr:DUF2080 family transposase-associated protein [Candidatus Woesearchaeota archaeon]
MIEQITKTVQQIGNGGHIYLPKELVGQKVVITLVGKSTEEIKEEILMIVKPWLEHVIGVYLYGSYARGEQVPGSDIDVLVITDSRVKLKKRINEYEIVSISIEGLEKTLESNAVLVLPILKEAKAILNEQLIEKYRKTKLTKANTRWYIETTESSLKIAREWIKEKDIGSMPNIVYPLIMRLRGLHMIECLISGKNYSNKNVDKLIKISPDKVRQLNSMYRENRDDKKISAHSLDYNDVSKLYESVASYFKKVRLLWEKLK